MRFIVIDGLDGVGKDTHARIIKKKYLDSGQSVILRSHPENDNIYGRKAREALLGMVKLTNSRHLFIMPLMLSDLCDYTMVRRIL